MFPIRDDEVVRQIEIGTQQAIAPELGYAGAEDKPNDEDQDHCANDDEHSNDHYEDSIEKCGYIGKERTIGNWMREKREIDGGM